MATFNVQLSREDLDSIADRVASKIWGIFKQEQERQERQERQKPISDDDLLRIKDIATLLKISKATAYQWVSSGKLPPGKHLKGTSGSRWRRGDILALFEDKEG